MIAAELRALCPFCGSLTKSGRVEPKFYLNTETGLYYCFHCGIKGKDLPDNLLEELDVIDEIQKKPFDQSSVAKLTGSSKELEAFKAERFPGLELDGVELAYSPDLKAIAIINRDQNGLAIGIKYRHCMPDSPQRYSSEQGSLNEGYWLKGEDDSKLLILEGEIDAISAKLAGFKGSILATQTNRLNESQLKRVKAFKNVWVLPDKDLGGEELKNSIEKLLGPFKVKVIELTDPDCKDLNELLMLRGAAEAKGFIVEATRTEAERSTITISSSVPEMLEFLGNTRNTVGDSTGWKYIDTMLGGGLRDNEMTVINAFAKTGKSSFINNLIHNVAQMGNKVALASFEMDPAKSIYPTLISIATGINIRTLDPESQQDLVTVALNDFKYLENVVTLKSFGYTSWETIEEWATIMKKQHDIKYLVLDHAGFMVEKMTDADENQVLAKNIKKLTNTLGIHIPVVVQAPKTKDGLSIQTSYGGMAWGQNADNFFTLERCKDNENGLKVKLEASRYPGANSNMDPAILFYDRDTLRLTD